MDKRSKERSHRDDNLSRGTGRHSGIDNSTRTSASRSSQREYECDKNDKSSSDRNHKDDNSSRSPGRHAVVDKSSSVYTSCPSEHEHGVEGLKDEELEEFLHSRY
ncbi:hypothetical protein V8G54_032766 [Vigna mungo]|uniref:Uncharacterized protein n=1 Tax=Vigna mungo TaxID=3915 RepID=A0AAQ3RFL2_VIGMU